MGDELEQRVRLLEAGQIVNDGRLNELEAWRRRDEPNVAKLVSAAQIAAEVRKALRDRGRLEWSRWQRLGLIVTAVGGGIAIVGEVVNLVQKAIGG